MQPPSTAPQSTEQLVERAQQLAGFTLGELASMAQVETPSNLRRHKGWAGQLLELWLGATAGSKPTQDFPELGIELKTVPIDYQGKPLETTYVCYAPLLSSPGITWETSNVYLKLQHVLWVPVDGEREIAPSDRRIATPFLWHPNPAQNALLKADWEEHNELITLGRVEEITARHGNVMQIRPKAANGGVLTDALGPDGSRIRTRPRGYYLRKQFTADIIKNAFAG